LKKNNLINSKGISVIFLIIAMLLMVTIGYVFSYLIPSKQKSVIFPIQSTPAFFIAQSGVEFAVRYATDNGWTTTALLSNLDGITRSLGSGRFILTYNYATYGDTLISVGEVPANTPRRSIRVSNFTSFLPQPGLVLWIELPAYPAPCWPGGSNQNIRFFIKNTGSSAITLNRFSASWPTPPNNRDITTIILGANTVFSGTYNYPTCSPCVRSFTPAGNTQTVNPNQVISVLVTWDRNISGMLPVIISFYNTTGVEYQFTLQPTGNCP
jgi:archaellum component FlaG (FlaF/FlaG flagellin family)